MPYSHCINDKFKEWRKCIYLEGYFYQVVRYSVVLYIVCVRFIHKVLKGQVELFYLKEKEKMCYLSLLRKHRNWNDYYVKILKDNPKCIFEKVRSDILK